jgi:signal peptidase II
MSGFTFSGRRVALLLVVGLVSAALDLGTKEWAHSRLASPDHPLPAPVSAAEVGRPVREVVARAWPFLSADELAAAFEQGDVRRVVRPTEPLDPDQKPYEARGLSSTAGGVYVFYQGFDQAPRRVAFNDVPVTYQLLQFALDGQPREQAVARVQAGLAKLGLADLLLRRDATLERHRDRLPELVRTATVPWTRGTPRVKADDVVAAGEVYLLEQREVDVIPGLFRFIYRENPNAAWGFFSGMSEAWRGTFLLVSNLVAMLAILVFFFRLESAQRLDLFVFAAIFGGAVGNVVDRLRYTFVIDFIDMYVKGNHWPTYNVADIAITCGVALLLLEAVFQKKKA